MSGKTKIVVLHMKELIYTGIFAVLGILFVVLLVMMFMPKGDDTGTDTVLPQTGMNTSEDIELTDTGNELSETDSSLSALTETDSSAETDVADAAANAENAISYIPGIYTTELVLGEQSIDVEVIVDKDAITSIRMIHLDEAVTTMYPLLQPTFDSICEQIYTMQTLEGITYSTDAKYTSLVLLEAIQHSLDKASAE